MATKARLDANFLTCNKLLLSKVLFISQLHILAGSYSHDVVSFYVLLQYVSVVFFYF